MSRWRLLALIALAGASLASAQKPVEMKVVGPMPTIVLHPRIFVDPPLPGSMVSGRVVIPYRTEYMRILPVFGPEAAEPPLFIGHLHVSLDGAPWVWVHASSEPVVLGGLRPGPHRVLLQLETANHRQLDEATSSFNVLESPPAAAPPPTGGPPATLVISAPMAEPLARGVLFVDYRAEGLRLLPVYGEAALKIAPPLGHIHVSVDGADWYWEDAGSGPIIINGLAPGRHQIQITLVNADHQPLDQGVVSFLVPALARH